MKKLSPEDQPLLRLPKTPPFTPKSKASRAENHKGNKVQPARQGTKRQRGR
jgi:hypothetical protein